MLTPDDLKAMVDAFSAPFDALAKEHRDEEAIRKAAFKLDADDRSRLYNQMYVLLVCASKIKAALGDGECELLGVGADNATLMNLLCAVNPHELSIDVIDRLSAEIARHFGGWTALPKSLFEAMCQRMDDKEKAYAEMEEDNADDATPEIVVKSSRTRH